METIKDLFLFIIERKKYWLLPVIIMLLIIGFLIVLVGNSTFAPFIYSIF